MNTRILIYFLLLIVVPLASNSIYAKSGCCSHHGGVAKCNIPTGFYLCIDGTDSPSCTCEYSNQNNSFNRSDTSSSTAWVSSVGCAEKLSIE